MPFISTHFHLQSLLSSVPFHHLQSLQDTIWFATTLSPTISLPTLSLNNNLQLWDLARQPQACPLGVVLLYIYTESTPIVVATALHTCSKLSKAKLSTSNHEPCTVYSPLPPSTSQHYNIVFITCSPQGTLLFNSTPPPVAPSSDISRYLYTLVDLANNTPL